LDFRRLKATNFLSPLLAVLIAFAIVGIIIFVKGTNPLLAYSALFYGAFGSLHGLSETFAKASPLLLSGLAATVSFKSKIWNIGAEGQLHMGAILVTWAGLTFLELPTFLMIPLVIVLSFLGGALWASIVGALKARFKVNEIILTLMLNYIAIYFMGYLLEGPWRDPSGIVYSPPISRAAWFPILIPGTRFHMGILLSLLCVPLIYVFLFKTVYGYRIRAIGASNKAADYGGINISKNIILTMFISGGLAGLVGAGEISGIQHRLMGGFSPWYGYFGVLVALLGRLHPFGVLIASVLFGGLLVGGDFMQRAAGVSAPLVYVLQGLIVIFLIGGEKIITRKIGSRE